MNHVQKFLSIVVVIFCLLTTIMLLGVLVDNNTMLGTRVAGSILLLSILFYSFLLARWLWNVAEINVLTPPIEASQGSIFTSEPEEPKIVEKLISFLVDDRELDGKNLRLLSLICLFLSGTMSFFRYTHHGWLWDSHLTFQPGLISSILAIILTSPLYMRGILKWNKSVYAIISFILIMLVFASFIELAMGGNGKSSIVTSLLVASIVLSWLGIKEVSGVCWMLVVAAALMSTIVNNITLGFYGFIYIVSGCLGLVLHSGLNPGKLLQGIKTEYSLHYSGDTISQLNENAMSIDMESLSNSVVKHEL